MAGNLFLKIDSVKGESTSAQGKEQISILSFSHGVSMPLSSELNKGGGISVKPGQCNIGDVTFTKSLDSTSPKLNQACVGGKNFKKMSLHMFEQDSDETDPIEYFTYEFEDCIITSVSIGGGGGDRPMETITVHFNRIKWSYNQQKIDGDSGSAGKHAGSWNLETNKKD